MPNLTWVGFLEKALWGLETAAARLCDAETLADFETTTDWWRKPIDLAECDGVEVPEETAVSGALQFLFEQLAADQVISGSPREGEDLRQFHFAIEKRRARDPAIGRRTKPTDIAIVLRAAQIFDLRIEAKTLLSEADIRSAYLSKHGLKRFEDANNPYTIEPYGGMLAYVVEGEPLTWHDRVRAELSMEFGPNRVSKTHIGRSSRTISKHKFDIVEHGTPRTIVVDVLHLVVEIEAWPSLRTRTPAYPWKVRGPNR